jgi:hypothetical protein
MDGCQEIEKRISPLRFAAVEMTVFRRFDLEQ